MSNERMRIDKWLWVARFFKTRSLASMAIASHKIRCNGDHVKPARDLKVGDELEITIGQTVFVVIVQGMAEQRRPAPEARLLYQETTGKRSQATARSGIEEAGAGTWIGPQGKANQAGRAVDPTNRRLTTRSSLRVRNLQAFGQR